MQLEFNMREYQILGMALENRKERVNELMAIYKDRSDTDMHSLYQVELNNIDVILTRLRTEFFGGSLEVLKTL